MKQEKNMDWKMFELLENDLSAEEAEQLLAEIELDSDLEAEWSLLQQTKLESEPIVYSYKKRLKKKETTLLAFSFNSWQKVASIAAVLALSFPLWKGVLLREDLGQQIPGAIIGLEHSDNQEVGPNVDISVPELVVAPETKESESNVTNTAHVAQVPNQEKQVKQVLKIEEEIPTKVNDTEIVVPEMEVINYYKSLAMDENFVHPKLAKKVAQSLIVSDDIEKKKFQGIRPTINIGLALLTAPFNNSKIKIGPLKDRKLEIQYRSDQYLATAMVSLKPIKN